MEINETWNQLRDAQATEEWPRMNGHATELINPPNAGREPRGTFKRLVTRRSQSLLSAD